MNLCLVDATSQYLKPISLLPLKDQAIIKFSLVYHIILVPCDRGYYLPRRDLPACVACPKGTYQDNKGQTECKPCLPGSSTVTTGTDHPAMCVEKIDVF